MMQEEYAMTDLEKIELSILRTSNYYRRAGDEKIAEVLDRLADQIRRDEADRKAKGG